MIMMPYSWRWSSLQLTGQADFWHPTGERSPRSATTCCVLNSRMTGQPGLRQGPRRHLAPRPYRYRRTDRPPRPQRLTLHLSEGWHGTASRNEPACSMPQPARCGLTSRDRSPQPNGLRRTCAGHRSAADRYP